MKKKHYKTSNFYLATFLFCRDQELVDIEKENPKRAEFVFNDSPEREDLVRVFDYGKEALVDARQYASALKELKNKIYS
jgi:hypothetical protein